MSRTGGSEVNLYWNNELGELQRGSGLPRSHGRDQLRLKSPTRVPGSLNVSKNAFRHKRTSYGIFEELQHAGQGTINFPG